MSIEDPSMEEEKTFFQKHRAWVTIGVVLLVGGIVVFVQKKLSGGSSSGRKPMEMVSVRLPPPPPTPPPPAATPPPQQELKQQEKMIEQAPVADNEEKKEEPPPEAAVSTGIKGDGGPDAFGVSGKGNGSQIGGGGSGSSGSKYGWYAAQVQTSIADALRKNSKTRVASIKILVRVWPDVTGRITRVKAQKTNDPALDQAIADALTGLQLKEAPPAGMPAPIVMRISAQR